MTKTRSFDFYDTTISICGQCLRQVEGKIVFQNGSVWLHKWCRRHGHDKVLIADDIAYYKMAREQFIKTPEMPRQFNTKMEFGCPYDCGLCPDHMQHSCLSLIEITDHCNLKCPICYASSGPHRSTYRSLEQVKSMLDLVCQNEGEPDVVQISGGEPTLHPQFFEIMDYAKQRPIKHLMLNTNGLRIAKDAKFAKALSHYTPGFELYLQWDGLDENTLKDLRGADLSEVRLKALQHCNQFDLSTTLVVTLKKGLNTHLVGDIIQFASKQSCVRGVTFQPIQHAGRSEDFDPKRHRLTLTEVRRMIIEQSNLFSAEDVIPVPCNPDALAMAYALKEEKKIQPLTRFIDPKAILEGTRNTIVFEKDAKMRQTLVKLFATNQSPESSANRFKDLLCCLPKIVHPKTWSYKNVFRVLIMAFSDVHNFDTRVIKRSCVHMATPDGKMIPFDTYNIFYRDDLKQKLASLQEELRV